MNKLANLSAKDFTVTIPSASASFLFSDSNTKIIQNPQIRAVVMTGFGGVAEAVAATKRGAVDFLIKPFQLSQLARVLQSGLEQQRLREENADLKAQLKGKFRFENIIGRHSTMQALLTTLELVSPMNSSVKDFFASRPAVAGPNAHPALNAIR